MAKKDRASVKKEFGAFAKKVDRIEALRNEIDMIYAPGFEKEIQLIRARMRDVSALPEIEKEIKALRDKIKADWQKKELAGKKAEREKERENKRGQEALKRAKELEEETKRLRA